MVYGLDCFQQESEHSFSAELFYVETVTMLWAGEQERDAKKSHDVPATFLKISIERLANHRSDS